LLIRDAAYEALPKATRAELHQRFAEWLEAHGQSLVELGEILGYHLEQACRYQAELGMEVEDELRQGARRHLTTAGRRALARDDLIAASQLLGRALDLVPEHEVDVPLEIDLAEALFYSGKGEEVSRSLSVAAGRAAASEDGVGEICIRLKRGDIGSLLEPHGAIRQLEQLIEDVTPALEAAENHYALYVLHEARCVVAGYSIRWDLGTAELERASYHARMAGMPHLRAGLMRMQGASRYYGSMPLSQFLTWLEECEQELGHDWRLAHWRAVTLGMLGRFDEARQILSEFFRVLEERGDVVNLGLCLGTSATRLELLAGNAAAALRHAEEGCRLLEEIGERAYLSTCYCDLAEALYALDRLDEAHAYARKGLETGGIDDVVNQSVSRQIQAKVLARRGQHAAAETLAREAITLVDSTDGVAYQGHARADLADVLELASRREEATAVLHQALDRYERKEALTHASRVRKRLSAMRDAPI
jgi:tetratricopeptide (TPR) repeat protein